MKETVEKVFIGRPEASQWTFGKSTIVSFINFKGDGVYKQMDDGTLKALRDCTYEEQKPYYAVLGRLPPNPPELTMSPLEVSQTVKDEHAAFHLRKLLHFIGDKPEREGLRDTPKRVVRAWKELFDGYEQDIPSLFKTFEEPANKYDEIIVLKNIDFTSFCEHHLLPFSGQACIGYIPNKKVIGVSKLARIVDCFAHRLQVQERMTTQICETIDQHLDPLGTGVIIEASHSCMGCRGIRKPNARMVTSKLSGAFRTVPEARAEFLALSR